MAKLGTRIKVFAGLILGIFAVNAVINMTQFTPTQMRVTSISSECSLEKSSRKLTKTVKSSTEKMACSQAEAGLSLAKFEGFKVKYHYTVDVDFNSPIDQTPDSGKLYFSNTKSLPAVGSEYEGLAHKKKKSRVKRRTGG